MDKANCNCQKLLDCCISMLHYNGSNSAKMWAKLTFLYLSHQQLGIVRIGNRKVIRKSLERKLLPICIDIKQAIKIIRNTFNAIIFIVCFVWVVKITW